MFGISWWGAGVVGGAKVTALVLAVAAEQVATAPTERLIML